MHQELSKDGEDHKLGDVKTTPLDQHTLGLHTSNFCFSINALYRINLERRFCFLSLERPPHYQLYMRELLEIWVELSWMLLKRLGKGCLSWFKKIHIVAWFMCFLMSINLQVFYQELSFIHVLMLNVTLLCLTWIG
jgi:hypothetical protein